MMHTMVFTSEQQEACLRYMAKFGVVPDISVPGATSAQLAQLLGAAAERDEPLTQETADALVAELGLAIADNTDTP